MNIPAGCGYILWCDPSSDSEGSLEAISLGGGLLVYDLLESLVNNDNKIISGIPNFIPSPSNLRYVVNKYRGDTFMSIAGFVFNYPYSISYDKVEHDGIVHLVKEIAFWNGERVQSIWLDVDASKRSPEGVEMSLDVSLNHIDTYQSDGGRTLLLGQTTDSGGGGVTESLASELENVGRISFFYRIVNFCLHAQSKALKQSVEQVYGAGGLGGVSFMQLLHIFLST